MRKILIMFIILLNLNLSLFAASTYSSGIDINLNDIGISLNQRTKKFNIKATVSYPLFAILENKDKFGNATLQDFLETICFHSTVNYNLISYKSLFLSLGLASDIFMQFDFSNEHSHYTAFSVGPYGEVGYTFNKDNKEKLKLSCSFNFPLIARENKTTNIIDPPEEEAWNELIDYNMALFNLVFMAYKINILIPF